MIVSLAVHIDCFACGSRFLSAILARSRPYLRRQLSGHTIDTLLFACPLWMHSPSLCIEGHVPTSYCISTDLSALLTPWHRKIPCARVRYEIVGGKGYCNTLSLEGTVPKVRQIPAMIYTRNHHTNLIQFYTMFCAEICLAELSKLSLAQGNAALRTFYFFKDVSIRFKDYWGKFKDFSRTWTNFSIFKDFSRGWCFFKDYSRPVRTM